jgi:glutamate N-acetyltransferase/amino-acid N-acetyltransferase
MTTDTRPKTACRTVRAGGKAFTIAAVAKGSGMLRPDMATLLSFAFTDAEAPAGILQEILRSSVDRSFNRITVDGDTSTNDTVLFLANGLSGVPVASCRDLFQEACDSVFLSLARQLVADGEGATRVFTVLVRGALSDRDARAVADTVANSPLVKTAVFGRDANWGRIMAAAGRAGVPLDPGRVDVFFDDVRLVERGQWCGPEKEAAATEILKNKREFVITIDLNSGDKTASVLTCDFSLDYVRINADYRS